MSWTKKVVKARASGNTPVLGPTSASSGDPRTKLERSAPSAPCGNTVHVGADMYSLLFEQSMDAIYIVAPDGTSIDANQAWLDLFGYTREELATLNAADVYVDPHGREDFLSRIAESGHVEDEVSFRRDDGTVIDCERRAVALKDKSGKVVAYCGIDRDITERKQAEKQAEEQAEEQVHQQGIFAEALMETSPACILVFGTDTKVVFANPETDRILGIPRDRVTGMTCGKDFILLDLAGQIVPEEQLPISRAALTNRPMYSTEYAFDSPTGRRILSISVAPLNDGFQAVSRVVATITDITDAKRHEQELEQAVEHLRKAIDATVDAMSAAIEMRDPYTAGHQQRVTVVARAIAKELGTDEDSVLALTVAGRMHDLGKLRIPAEILTKPGRLTALEFQMIKEHPQATYDLLKGIDFPWPVAEITRQHHERLDGSGYPRGLKGDEMLPEARILAVADVFEAMSSHRPYRPALGPEAALAELERNRGILYDPAAVDSCVRLVREKGFTLDPDIAAPKASLALPDLALDAQPVEADPILRTEQGQG